MATLSVSSNDQLTALFTLADELEENTPLSFKQLKELKSLFVRSQDPQILQQNCQTLQNLTCIPILPAELFYYSFPGEIECPDPQCANSLTWKRDKNGEYLPL